VFISLPETILSQCLRQIPIPYRNEHESEDPRAVPLDKPVKVFEFEHRVSHAHGDEPGCRRLLHIRIDVDIRVELNTGKKKKPQEAQKAHALHVLLVVSSL
jgi:hypothetical protein